MNAESPSNQLNIVTFQHAEAVCPVRQDTPDSAEALAESLTAARQEIGEIPGAFLPPDHRGAAVVPGNPQEIQALFEHVLSTPHHTVEVHPLAEPDERLAKIAADPGLLEGSGEDAVSNRKLLFERASEVDTDAGFDESLKNDTPSLSLVELEDFLKGKAAEIAAQH